MSRLIVKNLPNNITVEKLRDIFLEKGEITDVQLKYTKEGKFRNFGFIGFKNEDQALTARDYFNGTCIKSCKIAVETCVALGSSEKPKAWSKYAPDSSAFKKINNEQTNLNKSSSKTKTESKRDKKANLDKRNKIQEILDSHKDDPLFVEFLELHASQLKKEHLDKCGEDDIDISTTDIEKTIENDSDAEKNDTIETEKLANQRISDFEYMKSLMSDINKTTSDVNAEIVESSKKKKDPINIVLYTVKVQGMPFSSKKKDIKDFFKPLIPFTIRIPRDKYMKGFCYVGFKTESDRKKALFKNKSFLGGHRVTVDVYNKNNKGESQPDETLDFKLKKQEESLKYEETIAESGRLYVRNLPYITTEDELQKLFEKFGPVTEANMPIDKLTRRPKGFAHVTFMMPEHGVKAYTELDGSVFCGRMLHILPGKQKEENVIDDENLTFKQKKELKQKSQSGSSHNWNSLFLGANAVADVIADSYNTTKEKLLDSDNKMSAAVKLALGETQIVANTRKFLEENGVCLDAFNQAPKKRSKHIILIKNLPSKTSRNEILTLFEPFGLIARLVMPPHGISGIIEFVEPTEARQAFSKLAYTKFKYLPLYLEWAPDNTFIKPAEIIKNEKDTATEVIKVETIEKKDSSDDEDSPESNTILFVKGLNFETREDNLRKHFESCGPLYSVSIAMKNDPHNPSKKLSMGYGFIQFNRKSSTEKALKILQLSTLDGKQIELKRSERNGSTSDLQTTRKVSKPGKQTGTKILVRNIPFQANRKELYDIFGEYGEIKALRLPKKMVTGEDRHKGFCFVEYHNKSDAKKAFNALCQSTHLYGRRMVLEWAKIENDDEVVDTLRKRTAESYYSATPGGKKAKKSLVSLEDMGNEEDE